MISRFSRRFHITNINCIGFASPFIQTWTMRQSPILACSFGKKGYLLLINDNFIAGGKNKKEKVEVAPEAVPTIDFSSVQSDMSISFY